MPSQNLRMLRQVELSDMTGTRRVCWIEGGQTVRLGDAISLADDLSHTWFIERIYCSMPANWLHTEPRRWPAGGL